MIQLNSTIRNDIKAGVQNFEYLININDEVYVATRKQMLKTTPTTELGLGTVTDKSEDLYFEDANMRIGDLSEKIELKTKKPQLGNTTITFSNFTVYKFGREKKFSDEFQLIGKEIKIYFKTQSCKTLSECILVAQFQITRISHDDKKITITANDLNLNKTYKQIPESQYILLKDLNTFEHYSDKPIPTLYGHLENAPAIVYAQEEGDTFNIKLLPDTSYRDNSEIGGISKFTTDGFESIVIDDGTHLISNKKLQLVKQDVVKMSLGDNICDIPCLPYQQTRKEITDSDDFATHTNPQWFSNYNHIQFNVNLFANNDEIVENSTLWCSKNEKPLSDETISYNIFLNTGLWIYGSIFENDFNPLKTMMMESYYSPYFHSIGSQSFKFAPLTGYDLNDKEDEDGNIIVKSDVHFVGSLKARQNNASPFFATHDNTKVLSIFAPLRYDENAGGSGNADYGGALSGNRTEGVGFPVGITLPVFGGDTDLVANWITDFNEYNDKIRRTNIRLRGATEANQNVFTDYRTSFLSSKFEDADHNSFISDYSSRYENTFPTLDASVLTLLYVVPTNIGLTNEPSTPETQVSIEANWRDIELRRVWSNKEIFGKDFFVNAKGKLGDVEPNIKNISGHIEIKHKGTDTPTFNEDDQMSDNLHFTEFYKFLTNTEYKTKKVNGEMYELMLATYNNESDTYSFIYDIDIEDIAFTENLPYLWNSGNNYFNLQSFGTSALVDHNTGWLLKFSAKQFGESYTLYQGRKAFTGINLVYAKKIYENQNIVNIEIASEELYQEFELFNSSAENGGNYYEFGQTPQLSLPFEPLGYTFVSWDEETESKKLVERPHEIIQHLLSGQTSQINFDQEKINTIYEQTPEFKMAFSIIEKEDTSKIIEKICQQSQIYYRYRGRDKKIVVDMIKDSYTDNDLSGVIKIERLLKFNFKKSNIEDSCMGGLVVNYGYNYATENYDGKTEQIKVGSFLQQFFYKQYYGVDSIKDFELEIDAPYIQDKNTAEYFRDYYFHINKHQKLICNFELLMADGIQYEVGDIIKFNHINQPYGNDITQNNLIIDQESTPYFFITKVQKSLFRVKIECVQTHNITYDLVEEILLGDVNLDGEVTTEGDGNDFELFQEMLSSVGSLPITYDQLFERGYNLEQIIRADMNQNGIIDTQDVEIFIQTFLANDI